MYLTYAALATGILVLQLAVTNFAADISSTSSSNNTEIFAKLQQAHEILQGILNTVNSGVKVRKELECMKYVDKYIEGGRDAIEKCKRTSKYCQTTSNICRATSRKAQATSKLALATTRKTCKVTEETCRATNKACDASLEAFKTTRKLYKITLNIVDADTEVFVTARNLLNSSKESCPKTIEYLNEDAVELFKLVTDHFNETHQDYLATINALEILGDDCQTMINTCEDVKEACTDTKVYIYNVKYMNNIDVFHKVGCGFLFVCFSLTQILSFY